uniref:Solute carrier family 22 member 17-like n=1 Tax=Sinocyclocheilus grahami TaxID=75366 RepID=A0A672MID7_SINGR
MTSPPSPLASPSPCPPPPPSLPSSPTLCSPAPSSLPLQPALPPTGEVMILALGRKKQRLLIALSILPNLFLAFLLSSDPLLTLAPPFCCRLLRPSPAPQVTNASVRTEKRDGDLPQCKHMLVNGTQSCWDLVCARYWLVPVEEVCFILGTLTGCLGLGYTADRLGRQKSLLVSLMLAVVFGVLVCVSPSPPVFITMRFCLAAASAGVFLTLYVTRKSNTSHKHQSLFVVMLRFSAGGFPLILVHKLCILVSDAELDTESSSSPRRPHLSFPELLHSRNIWKNLCVLGFTSFISHGISHCYSSFRGDVRGFTPSFYWTYLLSVCAGGGAWLLLWATVDRFGRRGILLLAMTLTGLASLILLGLMDYLSESAMTVFSIMGLFSSQAAASLSILFTAEVMPTIIRGSGVGAVMALGCVGRLSSPLMNLRNHYGYFLHHVVYSSLALLAVLSILLLPESKRKPLPQTLADGEQYRRPPLGRRRRDNVPLLATPNPET